MKFPYSCLLLTFTLTLLRTVKGGFPCHANRRALGAWGCQSATLPYGLCKACPIKPVKPNGDFKDCKSIFNLDAPQCLPKLKQYVQLNPCDKQRKNQVQQWTTSKQPWIKKQAKQKLDYFIYALCEECCDCIPKSSLHVPWWKAKQNENLLYTSKRGNCPAHAHFDICKVLPNIRFFQFPGENAKKHWWPKICPPIKQWMNKNPGWINQNNAVTSSEITRFLTNVNRKTSCGDQQVWNRCKAMEKSQQRI